MKTLHQKHHGIVGACLIGMLSIATVVNAQSKRFHPELLGKWTVDGEYYKHSLKGDNGDSVYVAVPNRDTLTLISKDNEHKVSIVMLGGYTNADDDITKTAYVHILFDLVDRENKPIKYAQKSNVYVVFFPDNPDLTQQEYCRSSTSEDNYIDIDRLNEKALVGLIKQCHAPLEVKEQPYVYPFRYRTNKKTTEGVPDATLRLKPLLYDNQTYIRQLLFIYDDIHGETQGLWFGLSERLSDRLYEDFNLVRHFSLVMRSQKNNR